MQFDLFASFNPACNVVRYQRLSVSLNSVPYPSTGLSRLHFKLYLRSARDDTDRHFTTLRSTRVLGHRCHKVLFIHF